MLEPLGQLFADGLFDHAWAGKTDQGVRLGNLHIAQHGVRCGDAARCGMGQHHDVRQVRLFQHLHRNGCARHLHQRQDAFLHPRATGCGKQHQRPLQLHRPLCRSDDCVAHVHAHAAGHEGKVLRCGDDGRAADFALGHQHRLFLGRRLLGRLQAVGVFLLVAELQGIDQRFGHLHLGKDSAIKQGCEACTGADGHVVIAAGADIEIVRQLSMEQHGPAFVTFRPQVLGDFAAREQRVDLGADVVRDPVHRGDALWSRRLLSEICLGGGKCNSEGWTFRKTTRRAPRI